MATVTYWGDVIGAPTTTALYTKPPNKAYTSWNLLKSLKTLRHTPSLSLYFVDKLMSFPSMLFSILLIEEEKLRRVIECHLGMGSDNKNGFQKNHLFFDFLTF